MPVLIKKSLSTFEEPKTTPSVLADVPELLKKILLTSAPSQTASSQKKAILVSSNSLANRFILERWGIRPSQRRKFRNLFAAVRKHSRNLMQHYLLRGRVEYSLGGKAALFAIFKFDEIRGNLILGFVQVTSSPEWSMIFGSHRSLIQGQDNPKE